MNYDNIGQDANGSISYAGASNQASLTIANGLGISATYAWPMHHNPLEPNIPGAFTIGPAEGYEVSAGWQILATSPGIGCTGALCQ